jgi:hypothetical protein
MRALGALLLFGVITGVGLATPVPVLVASDGSSRLVLWLGDHEAYGYSYLNSIYEAPVEERHLRMDDRIQITSVRSSDLRAVEYFRWEGEAVPTPSGYEQVAPRNETSHLTIRVTPPYQQRLVGANWTIDLAGRFGDGVVRVSPERLPLIAVVLGTWLP